MSSSDESPPSRPGEEYGPFETLYVTMKIMGIEAMPDQLAWADATGDYVESFFNDDPDSKIWDVTSDVMVTGVRSVTPSIDALMAELFGRRNRRGLRGGKDRNLQEKKASTTITYSQFSKYKTTNDINEYDKVYVSTAPFAGNNDAYVAMLKELDPEYSVVTSVEAVTIKDPNARPVRVKKAVDGNGGGNGMLDIIIGAACGAILLLGTAFLLLYRRRRARKRNKEIAGGNDSDMESDSDSDSDSDDSSCSSNGNDSSESEDEEDDDDDASSAYITISPKKSRLSFRKTDLSNCSSNSSDSESDGDHDDDTLSTSNTFLKVRNDGKGDADSMSNSSSTAASTILTNLAPGEAILAIIAPPGKLGFMVDTSPEGGWAYVSEIKDSCPIIDQIQLEDKIIAIDDDDVQTMSAVNVSKMLAMRSRNVERKITVLRAANGPNGSSGGVITRADALLGGMQSAYSMDALLDDAEAATAVAVVKPKPGADEELIDLIAPAGKLGVVLVTPEPPNSGPAYVLGVSEDSPLYGKAKLGDKIMSVDDEDVREMSAVNVSMLLGSKSANAERRISVIREMGCTI